MVHKLVGLDMTLRVKLSSEGSEAEFLDVEGKKVTDPALVQVAIAHLDRVDKIDLDLDRSA